MNYPIKIRSLTPTLILSRFPRAWACLGMALFLMIAGVLWLPGKPVQAFGRLIINAGEGETFTLPEARVGASYEFQFQTEGGLAPFKWSVIGGAIPPGLRLEENGKLRGAPTEARAEAYAFVVEVADSMKHPQRFSLPCLLLVKAAPLRIVTKDNGNASDAGTDTRIADVSGAAFVEARPTAPIAPSGAPVNLPQGANNGATGAFSAAAASVQADKVQIVFPQDKAVFNHGQITLAIKIDQIIERLSVTVTNEKNEEVRHQIQLGRSKNEYSLPINLDNGRNTILVTGADAGGNETSKRIEITRNGKVDGGKITFHSIMREEEKPQKLSKDPAPYVQMLSQNNLLEAQVVNGDGKPAPNQRVTFRVVNGEGKLNGGEEVSAITDNNGIAKAKFQAGNIAGITRLTAEATNFQATNLDLATVDLTRWRYIFHLGAEFNNSANTSFGKQFLNIGLTTNTHWGDSLHTEFEARLTSVLQRDLLAEAAKVNASSDTPGTGAATQAAAESEQETDLIPFFTAKKALEVSASVFWDKFKLFEDGRSNHRARFGPIIKYQVRTRIDRNVETEKAELQRQLSAAEDDTERQTLQDNLDKLNQIAPPPKNTLSEIFAGLRVANYRRHYAFEAECLDPEEYRRNETFEEWPKGQEEPPCPGNKKPYRRNFYRNAPALAYFHVMWGASQQFQNEDRKMVLRRDAEGRPIPDANGNPQFDVKRFKHIGRFLLEGYMEIPKTRFALRFNGNLGPGEDEIRFSFLIPVDINRLRQTISLF